MTEKTDIKSLTVEELELRLKEQGIQGFRARQIFQWIHEKLADSFEEMTNLSKDLRRQLEEEYELVALSAADVKVSAADGTRKYLLTGGVPHGMPFLRVDPGRPGEEFKAVGDALPGLPDSEGHRGEGVPCGGYGNRGASGQL